MKKIPLAISKNADVYKMCLKHVMLQLWCPTSINNTINTKHFYKMLKQRAKMVCLAKIFS